MLAPFLRLLRFAGTSGLGLALDLAVYAALVAGGASAGPANAVSATCGVALVYVVSLRHVFDARERSGDPRLLITYCLYQAVAIPAASVLVALCTDLLGGRQLLGKAVVLPLTFLVNYSFMTWLLRSPDGSMTRG